MKRSIWIILSLCIVVMACTSVKSKVSTEIVPTVTAKVTSSINATWDYKNLQSIGLFAFGQSAAVSAVHGDYVQVEYKSNTGYVWIGLFEIPAIEGYGFEGMKVGAMLTCTNKIGASMKDKPSKYGKTITGIKRGETVVVKDVAVTYYRITTMTENGERTGWVYASNVEFSLKTNYITNQ